MVRVSALGLGLLLIRTGVHQALRHPRTRPERVIADKGYSYPRCRRLLRQREIPHRIPERRVIRSIELWGDPVACPDVVWSVG